MQLGAAIRSLRKNQSLSQVALSDLSKITQTALSQIEKGQKTPSQRTIDKICKALDVPEFILYLLALEPADMPLDKLDKYNLVYPILQKLLLQMATQGSTLENHA
jgi:transcriptional regulator with XRE-family HTH domain